MTGVDGLVQYGGLRGVRPVWRGDFAFGSAGLVQRGGLEAKVTLRWAG